MRKKENSTDLSAHFSDIRAESGRLRSIIFRSLVLKAWRRFFRKAALLRATVASRRRRRARLAAPSISNGRCGRPIWHPEIAQRALQIARPESLASNPNE